MAHEATATTTAATQDCLTRDQAQTWDSATLAFRLLDERVERDLQEAVDLPLTYYEVLVRLSESPHGSLRMSELAEHTHTKPSRISHAAGRLEKAGWIERRHCESDRRGWYATLTEDGRRLLDAAAPAHVGSIRANLLDILTPEQQAQLRQIGNVLVEHLSSQ